MIEAAHEIGVNTPVYISAGLDEKYAPPSGMADPPQERSHDVGEGFPDPGLSRLCMNTPYLDVLVAQIEEVVRNYDADGIFLDIVGVVHVLLPVCVASIRAEGGDPRDDEAISRYGERTYAEYAARTNETRASIASSRVSRSSIMGGISAAAGAIWRR